jgi:hypothetical protein
MRSIAPPSYRRAHLNDMYLSLSRSYRCLMFVEWLCKAVAVLLSFGILFGLFNLLFKQSIEQGSFLPILACVVPCALFLGLSVFASQQVIVVDRHRMQVLGELNQLTILAQMDEMKNESGEF